MNKPKLIGIDARFYSEAGPGRYVKNIISHLEKVDKSNHYIIFVRKKGWELYKPANENFKKVLADVSWYSWEEQIKLLAIVIKEQLDIYYVPHFNIPILYPRKIVTAIPDIIMHTFSTEKGTTLPKPYFAFKKIVYRLVLWWAIVRSSKVIVPTNDVLNDILSHYPKFSRNKFVIAPEGVDPDYAKEIDRKLYDLSKYGIKSNFLLYVSSMYDHKNLYRLIDAFEILLRDCNYRGQLVLVGKKDKFAQRVSDYVCSKNLQDKILLPGFNAYVSDDEVVYLRKNAEMYVFPSLKEGFSLTPLEAQKVGLPCVISDISCHREVFGDSVLYFNPYDSVDMANKIQNCLTDIKLRENLINKGYERVKLYDWLKTAETTAGVFNKL